MLRKPLVALLLLLASVPSALRAQTGTAVPELAAYDSFVLNLLAKYGIPGASLAITLNGRLVLARGYGYADAQRTTPVQPDSLFRILNFSSTMTSVAVLKLVEQGKLTLDQPAFALLPDLKAPPGSTVDTRIQTITIRHLLAQSAGWDRDKSGIDPPFAAARISQALGVPSPPSSEDNIRFMLGQPLDYAPGSKTVYSNFSFVVLGRIIERVTGTPYELWVRENILLPAGITNMRLGQSLAQGQQTGEVKYAGSSNATSVFADVPGPIDGPYGSWYLEATDSTGGWVGSAIDYAKFMNAIDGKRGTRLLSPASVAILAARPSTPDVQTTSSWPGMGVTVNTLGHWWNGANADGSAVYQIHTSDGYQYVLLLNSRALGQLSLLAEMDNGYWDSRSKVTTWPANDQFSAYPNTSPTVAAATPAILGREGVVNGATFERGVVSGSWFTIFGANLAPTTRLWAGSDFVGNALPEALDGVKVTVDGKPAFVYYISPTQINAQAPAGLTPGWRKVEVTRNGVVSGVVLTYVTANAPGALTYTAGGRKFAVATTPAGVVLGDPALSPGLVTSKAGDTVIIYTTALTAAPAGTATPSQAPLTNVGVTIGGKAATVLFAGLISPGLFQINAVVPTVTNGDQELLISIAGKTSPAGVVLLIRN